MSSSSKQTRLLPLLRFSSVEFMIYYLAIACAARKFCWQGYQLSQRVSKAVSIWDHWRYGLRPGWMLGVKQDLSDIQWRVFREGLPYAAAALLAFVVMSRTVQTQASSKHALFICLFGVCFAGYLHQANLVFPVCFSVLNYAICHSNYPLLSRPSAFWLTNGALLLAARLVHGSTFQLFSLSLEWLDVYQGPVQWQATYNLVALRQISFAMDKYWASKEAIAQQPVKPQHDVLKARQRTPLPADAYNLVTYLAYVYYPPLYIAGPIVTYNSFASQIRAPLPTQRKQVFLYAFRLIIAMLLMELMTHTLYFNSISKWKLWQQYGNHLQLSAVDMGMTGFWVLMIMWLKFLIIWRFFRFWALADGMQAPENMLRCICNNYDIEGFWKGWHASYNQWLVRYMYVPLGGSSTRVFNVWLIFTFVALWHDLEWRLLGWAWLTCLFFLPELALKKAAAQPWMAPLRSKWYFRHLCAAAGCCNIIALMAVNLVGFVVGVDGVLPFLQQCLTEPWFMLGTLVVCFSAVQIMFELRVWQHRQSGKRDSVQVYPSSQSVTTRSAVQQAGF